jgi:hypothetical protein
VKVPQELVILILAGGLISFILIVIFLSRKNSNKDPDNKKSSDSK